MWGFAGVGIFADFTGWELVEFHLFEEPKCVPFPLGHDFSLQVPNPVNGLLQWHFISAAGKLVPEGLTVTLSRAVGVYGTAETLQRLQRSVIG